MRSLNEPMRTQRRLCSRICLLCIAWLLLCGIVSQRAQAQTPDPILGQIVGADISVIGPSNGAPNNSTPAIEFSSGVTIVVHSGKAHIDFTGGGELDVCGPAKFTVLSSGDALTLALSFGRVHARFDALRPILIYTPMMIATPVSLGDQPRDATVGLSNTGVMCVLAEHGAVRLQNQLTGEATIVPQPSEVLVPSTSFTTLPSAAGQCRCDFDEPCARATPPRVLQAPPAQTATAPPEKSEPQPASSLAQQKSAVPASNSAVAPRDETAVRPKTPLVNRVDTPVPPVPAPPLSVEPVGPVRPVTKINLPPIGYDARSTTVSSEPLSVATLMLAQEAVVRPEWIFHGTVVAPAVETKSSRYLATLSSNAPATKLRKRGFWARLRAFLTGNR